MANPASEPSPEFSRTVLADSIGQDPVVRTLEATPEERDALARRFGLEAIHSLSATLRLRRARGGQMIRVLGRLDARVSQVSVVSLEPFDAEVEEEFEALFAPPEMIPAGGTDLSLDAYAEDDPEPIENGRIDLGELTAQHLSLALDPHPRRPDEAAETAAPMPQDASEGEGAPRRNPFAELSRLKGGG
jgi:uncharacterized metal-binding protein YceD (DUF177 family)